MTKNIYRNIAIGLFLIFAFISFVSADECAVACWEDGSCSADECNSTIVGDVYCEMCDPITCAATCLGDNRGNGTTCNDDSQCESNHCSGGKRAVSFQKACCPEESEWDYLNRACIDEDGNIVYQDEEDIGFDDDGSEEHEEQTGSPTDQSSGDTTSGGDSSGTGSTQYSKKSTDSNQDDDSYDEIFSVDKKKITCSHDYNKKILKHPDKDKIWLIYNCKKYHILNLKQLEDISRILGEQTIVTADVKNIEKGGKIKKVMGCLWNGKNIKDKKNNKLYFVNHCKKYHYEDTETWLDLGIQYGEPSKLYHTTVKYIKKGDNIQSTAGCHYKGLNIRDPETTGIYYISKHCKKRHYPNWETFWYYYSFEEKYRHDPIEVAHSSVKKIPNGKKMPEIKVKAKVDRDWKNWIKLWLGDSYITHFVVSNRGNVPLNFKVHTEKGSEVIGIFNIESDGSWKRIDDGNWYTLQPKKHVMLPVTVDARFISNGGKYKDFIVVETTDFDIGKNNDGVRRLPIKIKIKDFTRDAKEKDHWIEYPNGQDYAEPGDEIKVVFKVKNKNDKGHPWEDECVNENKEDNCERYGIRYTYGHDKVNWEKQGLDELYPIKDEKIKVKEEWEKDIAMKIPDYIGTGEYTTEWQMFYYTRGGTRVDFGPKMFQHINVERKDSGGDYGGIGGIPNGEGFLTFPVNRMDVGITQAWSEATKYGTHKAIDYNRGDKTSENQWEYYIEAAAPGQVVLSGWSDSYGYRVKIQHSNGYSTLYAHFASTPYVGKDVYVERGQRLGQMGDTGWSFGTHLHFEVINSNGGKVDPYNINGYAGSYPACNDGHLWTHCLPISAAEYKDAEKQKEEQERSVDPDRPSNIYILYNEREWVNQKNALLNALNCRYNEQVPIRVIEYIDQDFLGHVIELLTDYEGELSSGHNDVIYIIGHGNRKRIWGSSDSNTGIAMDSEVKQDREKAGKIYHTASQLPNIDKVEEIVLFTCHSAADGLFNNKYNMVKAFLDAGVDIVEGTKKSVNFYEENYNPKKQDSYKRYYLDNNQLFYGENTRVKEDFAYFGCHEAGDGQGGGESNAGAVDPAEQLSKELDEIETEANNIVSKGRLLGYDFAANLLDWYLDGIGGTITYSVGALRLFNKFDDAEKDNREDFEEDLIKLAKGLDDGEVLEQTLILTNQFRGRAGTDWFFATGTSTMKSTGNFRLERDGKTVTVSGTVDNYWFDTYDWNPDKDSDYLFGISQYDLWLLNEHGRAANFDLESKWTTYISGNIKLRTLLWPKNNMEWSDHSRSSW